MIVSNILVTTTHDQQSNSEKVIRELSSSLTVINCQAASASCYQALKFRALRMFKILKIIAVRSIQI